MVKYRSMINFISESLTEFKKVEWPDKEETARLTGYVISASLLVGLFVAGLDFAFKELLSLYIN
jgi:preprotein translocase SecE subunit